MARPSGDLGPEFTYDLTELKKVDPALVRYEQVQAIATAMETPRGMALAPDGRLLVAGDEKVRAFSDGKAGAEFAVGGPPHCVAAGPDGTVYVGLKERVDVYDADGKRRAAWQRLGERAYTTAIAATKENVFVADAGNRVLWRFDPAGNVLSRIGKKSEEKHAPGLVIPSPYFDVALGPEGMLWITDPGRRRVECYTYDGAYRFAWGKASMKIEGFCGCCNPTHLATRNERDRRAFLRGLVRWPTLAGLGTLGVYLATRTGEPVQAGQACVNHGRCRGCQALTTCGLPQARLARRADPFEPGKPRF